MKRLLLLIALILPILVTAQSNEDLAPWIELQFDSNSATPAPISKETEMELTGKLVQLQQKDSVTMVIVILDHLAANANIEDFARDYGRQYHIGNHNGIVFVWSVMDRKIRIEVADQLEGLLPDATLKEIEQTTGGFFAHGNYAQGLESAINAIHTTVQAGGGVHITPKGNGKGDDIVFTLLALIGLGGSIWVLTIFVHSHKKKRQEKEEDENEPALRDVEQIIPAHQRDHFRATAPPPSPHAPHAHPHGYREEHPHGYREEHPHHTEDTVSPVFVMPSSSPDPSPSFTSDPSPSPSYDSPMQSSDFGSSGFDGGGATSSY